MLDNAQYAPSGAVKVYIIDEVHMLSKSAVQRYALKRWTARPPMSNTHS